jgi:hypothetical protein
MRGENPNSLANLAKGQPFTSETAPKGRKNAGLSVNEWRNQLAEYCKDEIDSVLQDPKAPAAKLIAAREIKDAIDGDKDARRDLCDYSNHKPTTNANVTGDFTLRQPQVVMLRHGNGNPLPPTSTN